MHVIFFGFFTVSNKIAFFEQINVCYRGKIIKCFGRNMPTGRRDKIEEIIYGWEDNIERNLT